MAPEHGRVRAGHDERALGEAARVQDAEGAARLALGLEVRELLDRDAELLAERLLGPHGVAGDAVERRAALGEVVEDLLVDAQLVGADGREREGDRKSTRLNSSHVEISYAVFCLKKKNLR